MKKRYKKCAAKEKKEKERTPYSVLAGSKKKFFNLSNQLSNEKTEDYQKELQNQITELLLTPLGYNIKSVDFVTKKIFSLLEPLRWMILVSTNQVILLDRTRWNDKRLLRFDIEEILGRKETSTIKAMCTLLHKNSLISKVGYSECSSLSCCNADAECNRMCYIMKTHCIVRIA